MLQSAFLTILDHIGSVAARLMALAESKLKGSVADRFMTEEKFKAGEGRVLGLKKELKYAR